MKQASVFLSSLFLVTLLSCTSARISQQQIDQDFQAGRYEEAISELEKGLEKVGDGKDQLLYLLDLGLVHHTAGNFKKSNDYFLRADRVAEVKDYTSLSEEASTLLISDNVKDYQGEDFENVLISAYLAMNFALLGDREGALVESRRVNRKLYRMVTEGKRPYQQNAFARYLAGVLYESGREWDSAYIDYKKTRELEPGFQSLGKDLFRLAVLLRRPQEAKRWEEAYGLDEKARQEAMAAGPQSKKGELILIYQNGLSPEKRPNPQFTRVPRFYPRFNPVEKARVRVNGLLVGETEMLDHIEATAIAQLDEKYAGLVAKEIAGVIAKEVVADQVGKATESPLLGVLASFALHAADQADLRSWKLLPRDLQIARIPLDPGQVHVQVEPIGVSTKVPSQVVTIEAGKKQFLTFRYIP